MRISLDKSQLDIIEKIQNSHDDFAILGRAGTGKTTLLNALKDKLISDGFKVLCCASTGKAAVEIGGVTAHSLFGLKLSVADPFFVPSPFDDNIIKKADVILFDEISMCRIDAFTSIMNFLATLNPNIFEEHRPQMIFCGDFGQLPPVIDNSDAPVLYKFYQGKKYAFQSHWWKTIKEVSPCQR